MLALALLPLGGGVAAAHGGGGGLEPAPSFPRIVELDPPVPGLTVVVIEAGDRLRMHNGTGGTVEVTPPPGAARQTAPVVGPGETARWADPRIAAAAHAEPIVGSRPWTIPLTVGGQPVTVRGEQVFPPPPASGLWWLATTLVAIAVTILGFRAVSRRPEALAVAAVTVLAIACHVIHVLGSALVPEAQSYPSLVLSAAGIGLAAWLFGLVGVALTLAGRPFGLLLCAVAGAILAMVTAFGTPSYSNAVLPFAWNPALDRAAIVLAFGAGIGLFLTGFAVLRKLTAPPRELEDPVADPSITASGTNLRG